MELPRPPPASARTLYIAISRDGFIADAEGGVDWLHDVAGEGDYGYTAFYGSVDALAMGHNTCDTVRSVSD